MSRRQRFRAKHSLRTNAALCILSRELETMGDKMGNLIGLVIGIGVFAGWLNHLYACFTEQMWGFLIAGAIFFPIGVVHGWGLWLGFW